MRICPCGVELLALVEEKKGLIQLSTSVVYKERY